MTAYLRAWALEAELSRFLRDEYGSSWFASRKAGSLLRELWNEGLGLRAEELVDQVSGGSLELAVVAEQLRGARAGLNPATRIRGSWSCPPT